MCVCVLLCEAETVSCLLAWRCSISRVSFRYSQLRVVFTNPPDYGVVCSPSIASGSNNSQVDRQVYLDSTYSLVQVDGVLAGDNVGNGRSLLLAGGLDVGHF